LKTAVRSEISELFPSRVTILAGHFGSGKTEIALNAVLALSEAGKTVSLVDVDVVKPYFRSRSAKELLAQAGVELIAPTGELYSSDLPVILPEVRSKLRDPSCKLVMDAGGDDIGSRVVGSFSDVIPVEELSFYIILNFRRPFTESVEAAVSMVRSIEIAARQRVTAVISNTHLMDETTPELVLDGYRMAVETAGKLGVEVAAVTVQDTVISELDEKDFDCRLVTLNRIVTPPFAGNAGKRTVGPLFAVG